MSMILPLSKLVYDESTSRTYHHTDEEDLPRSVECIENNGESTLLSHPKSKTHITLQFDATDLQCIAGVSSIWHSLQSSEKSEFNISSFKFAKTINYSLVIPTKFFEVLCHNKLFNIGMQPTPFHNIFIARSIGNYSQEDFERHIKIFQSNSAKIQDNKQKDHKEISANKNSLDFMPSEQDAIKLTTETYVSKPKPIEKPVKTYSNNMPVWNEDHDANCLIQKSWHKSLDRLIEISFENLYELTLQLEKIEIFEENEKYNQNKSKEYVETHIAIQQLMHFFITNGARSADLAELQGTRVQDFCPQNLSKENIRPLSHLILSDYHTNLPISSKSEKDVKEKFASSNDSNQASAFPENSNMSVELIIAEFYENYPFKTEQEKKQAIGLAEQMSRKHYPVEWRIRDQLFAINLVAARDFIDKIYKVRFVPEECNDLPYRPLLKLKYEYEMYFKYEGVSSEDLDVMSKYISNKLDTNMFLIFTGQTSQLDKFRYSNNYERLK